MKVKDIVTKLGPEVINKGEHFEDEITSPACCDLLSIAMANLPAGCAWVTVMSNVNTLAVAALAEVSCVILALNTPVSDEFAEKAKKEGITVLRSAEPIFETALAVWNAVREAE